MARVQPPGKMPGRLAPAWLQRLLGARLAAAVLGAGLPPPGQASQSHHRLPAPTGLNITATGSSQVSLSWTAPLRPRTKPVQHL